MIEWSRGLKEEICEYTSLLLKILGTFGVRVGARNGGIFTKSYVQKGFLAGIWNAKKEGFLLIGTWGVFFVGKKENLNKRITNGRKNTVNNCTRCLPALTNKYFLLGCLSGMEWFYSRVLSPHILNENNKKRPTCFPPTTPDIANVPATELAAQINKSILRLYGKFLSDDGMYIVY